MTPLHDFLAQLEDGKAVRVAIAMQDSAEKERIPCVYSVLEPPRFALSFLSGTLPVNRIDRTRKCVVLIDLAGQTVSLASDIDAVVDSRTLHLIGREVISHEQLREFFRVDVHTQIKAACIIADSRNAEEYRLTGETVDVSGNGMLANFDQPLQEDELLSIDLVLPPGGEEEVRLTARVVRSKQIKEDRYQVGLHFEQVDPETRDKIMASCFKIQRDHLRLRVRVKR